jgi:hypothetical protein
MSVKLLGFAALAEAIDSAAFAAVIRSELEAARDLLGANMIAVSGAATGPDLIFLRTCIELRIPTIVFFTSDASFLPETEKLLGNLLSVSLAKYPRPSSSTHLTILEWADALLCPCRNEENEILSDALALGIPTRKLDSTSLAAHWTQPPHASISPRHGFPTRRELLEFLDIRFGKQFEI